MLGKYFLRLPVILSISLSLSLSLTLSLSLLSLSLNIYIYIYIYNLVINVHAKITSVLQYTPLMMLQDQIESIKKPINYGRFIDQFLPDTIKFIWRLERKNTKIYRQRMSILFHYIYIYIYIYIKVKLATIVEGDPKAAFSIAYYTKV